MKRTTFALLSLTVALLISACQPAFNDSTAVSIPVSDLTATPTATATATASPTPSPTATATHTPKPTATTTPTATASPTVTPSPTATPIPRPTVRQLTQGACCVDAYWFGNDEIRFLDRDPETELTGIWAIDLTTEPPERRFVTERLGISSPDGRYLAYPDRENELAIIDDLETGQSWALDLGGDAPSFSPNSRRILWTVSDDDLPFEARSTTVWLADINGENRQRVGMLPRGSVSGWLDDETLLVTLLSNTGGSRLAIRETTIGEMSLVDGTVTPWLTTKRARGLAMNPASTGLIYNVLLAEDPADNGLWYVDLTSTPIEPQLLPFLGAYQWRSNQEVIFVPYDFDAAQHFFYSYNVETGQTKQLTNESQPALTITNNDWSISPDGNQIVLFTSKNLQPDGLWTIDLGFLADN